MRKAFVKALCELASKDSRVFLLTGDLGFNILEPFIQAYPERFLNVGVAESNLITVAAGLAALGFVPFVYSIATFASMRPFEQIRNIVSWQNLNVKIIGVGGGLAYAKAGPSHHSSEDIALMRTLPHMSIISPVDPQEAYLATKAIYEYSGPVYMRFERNPEKILWSPFHAFTIGKGYPLEESEGIALLATGTQVATAIRVHALLKKKNISSSVFAFPTIYPLDVRLLRKIVSSHHSLVTIEEHAISGGFSTEISEFLVDHNVQGKRLVRFGMKKEFTPISASYDVLVAYHGFSVNQIVNKLLQYIK